jgi:hypothetical protein
MSAVIPKPVMILTVHCGTLGSNFTNILYYEPPSGISTAAAMDAVANAAFATLSPLYAAVMNNTATFLGCTATYNNGTNEYIGYSSSAAVAGTLANGSVGDQNAVVLRKQTNLVGRSNRGRWFIGGMDYSAFGGTNSNELDSGITGAYQTLVAAMVSDQTWDAFLFHARHWDRKTSSLVVIEAGAVSTRLATQRSRRRHSLDFAI